MKREKMAWMVSIALVAILALQLPGTLAQRDDDYSFVRTLIDIHRQVASNYVDSVDESKLREGAIDGMLGQLDPFTVYVPPARQDAFDQMLEGSFKGVGIQLDQRPEGGPIEVITPIDGSPAYRAGVLPGDIILKVNGESVEGLKLQEVVKKIAGKLGSEVTLSVRHATNDEADLKMERAEIVVPTVKGYQRNPDNSWDYYISDDPKVGYIRITQFTGETYEAMRSVIEKLLSDGMKGLVLDLRYNPGGQLDSAIKIVDMFIDHGTIVSTRGRNRPEQTVKATAPETLPYFPIVVIVNEHSASAAEIVAGSLMDNKRALVVGERSYGKGSVQELIPLEQKSGELKLTVAYYYLPSGRLVHKKKDATDWGVQPTIVVPMDDPTQRKVFTEMSRSELFRRPVKPTTTPSTGPTTAAAATTQPMLDVQLQRAVDTLVATVVLQGQPRDAGSGTPVAQITAGGGSPIPTTRQIVPEIPDSTGPQVMPEKTPTTVPVTAPVTTAPATPAPATPAPMIPAPVTTAPSTQP